ncbi:MAG: methyltransferase [Sphingomonadaceae bacterium]|jgi:protein-S-isoprenylcysteine O-methyltransferase Ste14|nr:methyltransferase [Sphingomonadaceae bacterium]
MHASLDQTAIAKGPPAWLTPRRLDRAEQVTIVLLWALLAHRVYEASNPFAPLIMLAETSVVIFVLLRRPTERISMRLGDWLLAATATYAPLLIMPAPAAWDALVPLAVGLVLFGNVVQIAAKLFLRRSFGIAPANRGIKQDGMYRFVRHPMYAGYLFVHIGILLLMPSVVNLVIYALGWWAQILRLLAEERLLSQDPAYRDYMQKTRWRLVPGIF